jgi:GT2 family glycosyltransferase
MNSVAQLTLRQRLKAIATELYHSDQFIPHRVKRRLRKRLLDPLQDLWGKHINPRNSHFQGISKNNDAERQKEANLLHSINAKRDLYWFLDQPKARVRIGRAENNPTKPLVSIVLVLFNKAELSYACLRSLEQLRYPNLELIVVDNCSTDETSSMLSRIEGQATILRQDENLHFLRGCNRAFQQLSPRSHYVLLVNNDALLDPLAVDQAVSVFERWPETGIVGGQVLHLDGCLQEAGNVIFRDGVCSGLGRRQRPLQPLAQVRRKVDYVSGCLLMIKTDWLQKLGGFDERFAPAYYEETDLCIRSWQCGRPVIYEPSCQLRHVEFASSQQGQSDAEVLMQRNRDLLKRKHHAWLQDQPTWENHKDFSSITSCLRTESYPARILWIDDRNPDGRYGAGYGRMEDIIKTLADLGYYITILATHQNTDPCLHAHSADYELIWGGIQELESLLEERAGFYTHICASRNHNLQLLKTWQRRASQHLSSSQKPLLVGDIESLFSIREHAQREVRRNGKICTLSFNQLLKLPDLREEIDGLQNIDRFLTVSQREADLLSESLGKPVEVAGHAFTPSTPSQIPSYHDTHGLLFMGAMNHPDLPNLDSLHWLADTILPALRNLNQLDPQQAHLTVIGPYREDLVEPLLDRIRVLWPVRHLGHLERVEPELRQHRLLLAPTRFAAGLPHKVQHAISQGIPVVTTELIASQMGWQSGQGLQFSNNPVEYAALVADLYSNQQLWTKTQKIGLEKIHKECRLESLREALHRTFISSDEIRSK